MNRCSVSTLSFLKYTRIHYIFISLGSVINFASAHDEELMKVRACWKSGDWTSAPAGCKMIRVEITVIGKLVLRDTRIVVPTKLRKQVLELAHDGHPGIVKMKDRLRSKVWWPAMSNKAEAHCRSCHACQSITLSNMAPPVKSTSMPTQPWRHLEADLMGPLPSGESLLVAGLIHVTAGGWRLTFR